MVLRGCFLFTLAAFLILGEIAYAAQSSVIPTLSMPIKQNRSIEHFSGVDVQGRIHVTLHTGYKKPQIIVRGDIRDIAQLTSQVRQNILFIALGKGYPAFGPIHVDIRGQTLDEFRYAGEGSIRGNRLYTSSLNLFIANEGSTQLAGTLGLRQLTLIGNGTTTISGISSRYMLMDLRGDPKVQLSGNLNLAALNIEGKARLKASWLKSYNLTIRARKGAYIQLGGIVNKLDVELWGFAHFDGRYLRAQRSFVKTHQRSVAEISSLNHQSTLATDASDIHYYNLPVTRADFMAYNGAVLDFRDLSDPFVQEYTRYNKQFP